MPETQAYRQFLSRLTDLTGLALIDDGRTRSVMDSSLNQKMGPRDCNFYLRSETDDSGTWQVLVDYSGPGCLTRFWTAGDFDGDLEIFFDGAASPSIRTTLQEFFSGRLYPFVKPIVMDCEDSSKGRVSYLPVPFKSGCKVRARSDTTSFYWQINALLFDATVSIETLPTQLDAETKAVLNTVCNRWRTQNGFPAGEPAVFERAVLAPRGSATLLDTYGPGCIQTLAFDTYGRDILNALSLQIHWDGADEPAVRVPLSHFFCQGSKHRDFSSLFLRRDENHLTCALPMPFRTGARVTLVNPTTAPITVGYAVGFNEGPVETDLRFHCVYEHEYTTYGTIIQLLNRRGRGRFIGLNQVTRQFGYPQVACYHQEGNEYIFVDAEQDPVWVGTGTEDYYNCAYFYELGEVDTPTHGCLDQHYSETGLDNRGLVSAYRWQVLDAVPFHERLLILQEAGCPKKGAIRGVNGKEHLGYQWTCYWYEAKE